MEPERRGLSMEGVLARISAHEAICSERYANLIDRLKRLELVIWSAIGALLLALLALITHKLLGA